MEYEIRTVSGYVFLSRSDTGFVWKLASGEGKRYATPGEAVEDQDALRTAGYACGIVPIEE